MLLTASKKHLPFDVNSIFSSLLPEDPFVKIQLTEILKLLH